MSKYKIKGDDVVNTETESRVIHNPNNENWQDYLEWVAEGNTADPEFAPTDTTAFVWMTTRFNRDRLLVRTDFFMVHDVYNNVLASQEQIDLSTYRQALRDLPSNTPDPRTEIIWPVKPQVMIDYAL